ncbi:hypothetical protein B0T26DRAFT_836585 [Lasiosphaeria miniovina]|uniref:Apple domain-containing protein n=1 Tax=Lasiosphaeria miniovina TaxID=1954250 RepID=A0AA40A6P7_9PEZI|nr:uncharacterized protein B0T26DRAFT_836585 [Lasiosphaeria miniovina]KAK0710319.1 hypothetical protein B0T26DRAFT_836585 [Lasiosphaeria miniovina]
MASNQSQSPPSQPFYNLQDAPPVPPGKGPVHYQHQSPVQQTPRRPPQQLQQPYNTHQPFPEKLPAAFPPAQPEGLKRSVVLGVLALIAFLFLAVIGLGAGLGVSQRDLSQAKSDLKVAEAVASAVLVITTPPASTVHVTHTPSPTTQVTPTRSTTPAAASSTGSSVASASSGVCPGTNGTFYTSSVASGSKRFQRLCGLDFSGPGQAEDIGSVNTTSLNDCIDACAAKTNCTGAGWGIMTGTNSSIQPCWMKTNLNKNHKATVGWGFAILTPQE